MKRTVLFALLLLVSPAFAQGDGMSADQRAAAETLQAMRELAEAGDWGAYVDRYYGEAHKFRSGEDRDALVRRFEERWGARVVDGLKKFEGATPEIDGDKALFYVEGNVGFVLHRHADGRWTFHL